MSVDTDRDRDGGDSEAAADIEELEALGRDLGHLILDLPTYERYEEAKSAVEDDEEAQEAIREFEQLRQEYALARRSGTADQESLREVQAKQRELHSLPVMEEYLKAQEALQGRLERINEAISAPLEVDFGGEAGGCCQD